MATVYAAEHIAIEKRVAVKVLTQARCDATARRFLQEARAASRLRHDHIIDVTDFGRDTPADGEPVVYFAMEQLEGEDLATTLEQDGPLRWTRVLAIAKQICGALIAAHAQGIVHCDIKPANCFRIHRGDTQDFIKVLDFGVASFACERTGKCTPEPGPDPDPAESGSRRKSSPRLGTPGYMAAELLSGGSFDHRVDIYALGVLMYRLLTNKMPYPAARLYSAAGDSGPSLSGFGESGGMTRLAPFPMRRAIPTLEISPDFEAVVLKALAQDPEQRHANAQALLAELEAAEHSSLRSSPLPRDPLSWGGAPYEVRPEDSAALSQTEVSRVADGSRSMESSSMESSSAGVTAPDLDTLALGNAGSWRTGSWRRWARAAALWPALAVRATVALVVTTVVVRAAWSFVA
ncbi:MAG: serine/threonine protein kinase [Nannocystis sp.]|nr:serine/threonine protein kinase [Nannocystis sp.]